MDKRIREDLILAAMSSCAVGMDKSNCVAGMLLTGGVTPQKNILRLLRRTQIPVVLVDDSSYAAATAVKDPVSYTHLTLPTN